MRFEVIHDTPGRLRIAVPAIEGSRAQARACEAAVAALPGVRHAQANALTGNLLVLYHSSPTAKAAILHCCAAWAGGAPQSHDPARCPNRAAAHAASRQLMGEVVRHALPLLLSGCPFCRRL